MSEPKQIIIIRKDLKMRRGKEVAQACHASMKVVLDAQYNGFISCRGSKYVLSDYYHLYCDLDLKPLIEWLGSSFTKICLCVNSLEELESMYKQAQDAKIPCAEIIDEGRTEFHGVPTKTCIAIGPYYPDEIDKITKHLKLL